MFIVTSFQLTRVFYGYPFRSRDEFVCIFKYIYVFYLTLAFLMVKFRNYVSFYILSSAKQHSKMINTAKALSVQ